MFEKGNQHAGIVTKQLHKTCPTKTCAQLFGHRGELRLRSKASDPNSGANVSYKLLLLCSKFWNKCDRNASSFSLSLKAGAERFFPARDSISHSNEEAFKKWSNAATLIPIVRGNLVSTRSKQSPLISLSSVLIFNAKMMSCLWSTLFATKMAVGVTHTWRSLIFLLQR